MMRNRGTKIILGLGILSIVWVMDLFSEEKNLFRSILENENKEVLIKIPDSFYVGSQWVSPGNIVKEFIPIGEKIESWTKIVTILENNKSSSSSLEIITKDMQYNFRKLYDSRELLDCSIEYVTENGMPVSFLMVDKPGKNINVQPTIKLPHVNELVVIKTIKGKEKTISLQYCQRYDKGLILQTTKTKIKEEMKEFLNGMKVLDLKAANNEYQLFCHKNGFKNLQFCDSDAISCIGKKANFNNMPHKKKDRGQELENSEVFTTSYDLMPPIQGEIKEGRYYSPNNAFSCNAYDFGEGRYLLQDCLEEDFAAVGFYNSVANFKKAEILFLQGIDSDSMNKIDLKDVFNDFGIGILKKVDHAQDIKIICEEEMDNGYFVAISIRKMSVLKSPCGKYIPSTRGYFVFKDKAIVALLSNQVTTMPGQTHIPESHVKKLKEEILEFRKSFKFDL